MDGTGCYFFVLAGLAIWLFLGSITQRIGGMGIIISSEWPRHVIMPQSGQVDSIFCQAGDTIHAGKRLFGFKNMENQVSRELTAPDTIIIAAINLRVSDFASMGSKILEYNGLSSLVKYKPEVRFLLDEQSMAKVKPGMQVTVYPVSEKRKERSGRLTMTVSFLSGVPASAAELRNYRTDHFESNEINGHLFEVRALLNPDSTHSIEGNIRLLPNLNNQRCKVVVEVARQTPLSWLFSVSR